MMGLQEARIGGCGAMIQLDHPSSLATDPLLPAEVVRLDKTESKDND